MTIGIRALGSATCAWRLTMEDGTRLRAMDDRLTRQCRILDGLNTSCRELNETQAGIKGKLEQILERLNTIARRSTPVSNQNCDETGRCVCSIDCGCAICMRIDATFPESAGCCVRSMDCECDICIGSDTSSGSKGLNGGEMEVNRPTELQVLDEQHIKLDSLVLGCTREPDLFSGCFNTWLECVEFKRTRVASYLFDKMRDKDSIQVVHGFIRIKSKLSHVLAENGLVVPVWDLGIGLKIVKLVGYYKCEDKLFASKVFEKMLNKNVVSRLCVDSTFLELGEQQHRLCCNARPNSSRVKKNFLMFVYSKLGWIEGFLIKATKFPFNNLCTRKLCDDPTKHCILKGVIRVNQWLAIAFGMHQCPWFDTGQELLTMLDNGIFDTGQGTNGSRQRERKPHFLILECLASCFEAVLPLDNDFELRRPSSQDALVMIEIPLNVIVFTDISLGLLYLGSCYEHAAQTLLFTVEESRVVGWIELFIRLSLLVLSEAPNLSPPCNYNCMRAAADRVHRMEYDESHLWHPVVLHAQDQIWISHVNKSPPCKKLQLVHHIVNMGLSTHNTLCMMWLLFDVVFLEKSKVPPDILFESLVGRLNVTQCFSIANCFGVSGCGSRRISNLHVIAFDAGGSIMLHQSSYDFDLYANQEGWGNTVQTNFLMLDTLIVVVNIFEQMLVNNFSNIQQVTDALLADFPLSYCCTSLLVRHSKEMSTRQGLVREIVICHVEVSRRERQPGREIFHWELRPCNQIAFSDKTQHCVELRAESGLAYETTHKVAILPMFGQSSALDHAKKCVYVVLFHSNASLGLSTCRLAPICVVKVLIQRSNISLKTRLGRITSFCKLNFQVLILILEVKDPLKDRGML